MGDAPVVGADDGLAAGMVDGPIGEVAGVTGGWSGIAGCGIGVPEGVIGGMAAVGAVSGTVDVPSGAEGVAAGYCASFWASATGAPQTVQNRAFGSSGVPQAAHAGCAGAAETGVPHSVQNRAPSSSSAPHRRQIIAVLLHAPLCGPAHDRPWPDLCDPLTVPSLLAPTPCRAVGRPPRP
nr:hypothetical protein [Bifidobacterium phasiani]